MVVGSAAAKRPRRGAAAPRLVSQALVTPENDKRLYRLIDLDNDLRILLISDPEMANQPAAPTKAALHASTINASIPAAACLLHTRLLRRHSSRNSARTRLRTHPTTTAHWSLFEMRLRHSFARILGNRCNLARHN